MKRIIIIFIIALCLLSFIEISCLAQEPLTNGGFWNSSTFMEKLNYITGFRMGILKCVLKLGPLTPKAKGSDLAIAFDELIDLYGFIKEHTNAIITVMDDLYKDPANTYIQLELICEIACQKLKGEDIEPLLQEARKKALLEK